MTNETKQPELKPCPFCGNAPRYLEHKAGFYSERVICDTCEYYIEIYLDDPSKWNNRAKQPTLPEVLAKVREAISTMLKAERSTTRPPATFMEAESKLDLIRSAVKQAEEAIALLDSVQVTSEPVAHIWIDVEGPHIAGELCPDAIPVFSHSKPCARCAELEEQLHFQGCLTRELLPYQDEAVKGRGKLAALEAENAKSEAAWRELDSERVDYLNGVGDVLGQNDTDESLVDAAKRVMAQLAFQKKAWEADFVRMTRMEAAIERMRIAGGKEEFQKAFDDAKDLL